MNHTITPSIARLTALATVAATVASTCGTFGNWSDTSLKTNITALRSA